jgi:calcium-dependent protein kinase
VIAGCLSEEEIRGLKEMFKGMDTDNSGTITLEELKQGLAKQGTKLSEYEVKQLMDAVSSLFFFLFFSFFFFLFYLFKNVILL